MLNKKGFSFIEVLVIVVLIAILSLVAVPSYKKGVETSKNNQARSKLLEVATAAQMYNEDARDSEKVFGYFGKSSGGTADKTDPVNLFSYTVSDNSATSNYAYLKDVGSFSGSDYTFRGYKFYICKPTELDSKCGNDMNIIAIMEATDAVTDSRYSGKTWRVSTSNPGKVVMVDSSSAT